MSKSEEAMHGITFKDKIGYAMGDMGGLLTFGLVSAFLNMPAKTLPSPKGQRGRTQC